MSTNTLSNLLGTEPEYRLIVADADAQWFADHVLRPLEHEAARRAAEAAIAALEPDARHDRRERVRFNVD